MIDVNVAADLWRARWGEGGPLRDDVVPSEWGVILFVLRSAGLLQHVKPHDGPWLVKLKE